MSQENLVTLRAGLEAFNRRDREAWLAICDPDYETVPSDDWPELEPIRGAEAAWDSYIDADESWEDSRYEAVELIDAGDDKVIAQLTSHMRGKASGAEVEYSYWILATFRNGKVRRMQWFMGRGEALEAAGVEGAT